MSVKDMELGRVWAGKKEKAYVTEARTVMGEPPAIALDLAGKIEGLLLFSEVLVPPSHTLVSLPVIIKIRSIF